MSLVDLDVPLLLWRVEKGEKEYSVMQPKPPNRKSRLWIAWTITVIFFVGLIIANYLFIKIIVAEVGKSINLGPCFTIPAKQPLTREHILGIATVVIPSALVAANIILVIITFYYARHTKIVSDETRRMADETAKMVEHNEQQWKLNLLPLLVPLPVEMDQKDTPIFRFKNHRGLALFVKCSIMLNIYAEYKSVERGQEISFKPVDFSDLLEKAFVEDIQNAENFVKVLIMIDFQDTLSVRYRQVFHFYMRKDKWDFEFNKESLPWVFSPDRVELSSER